MPTVKLKAQRTSFVSQCDPRNTPVSYVGSEMMALLEEITATQTNFFH